MPDGFNPDERKPDFIDEIIDDFIQHTGALTPDLPAGPRQETRQGMDENPGIMIVRLFLNNSADSMGRLAIGVRPEGARQMLEEAARTLREIAQRGTGPTGTA